MHNSEPATYDVALLRQDMTAKGWLPIDLARKAEVSHMTVSRFLSGERHYWRKGQEALITLAMEALLSKGRILEIYLNSVEWGEGVYGARAAAEHYYRTEPHRLQPLQAARLAVMLPRPRFFEKRPDSPYLASRAEVIVNRMNDVALP